jgi:hypothetical protein
VDHEQQPGAGDNELLLDAGGQSSVARYMALERQKRELRRERDRLMLDLARDLGPTGLAERFGVTRPAIIGLLAGARERLRSAPQGRDAHGPQITAHRLRPGEGRWAEADAHYEALGRPSQ